MCRYARKYSYCIVAAVLQSRDCYDLQWIATNSWSYCQHMIKVLKKIAIDHQYSHGVFRSLKRIENKYMLQQVNQHVSIHSGPDTDEGPEGTAVGKDGSPNKSNE